MSRWLAVTLILVVTSEVAALAQALPAAARVEGWATIGPGTWRDSTFLDTDYEPQLVGFESEGRAHQRLTVDPGIAVSLDFGTNVFPSRAVGVQGFVEFASTPVSGTNGPYAVELHYVSQQPPSSQLVPVDIESSTAWEDTNGHLDTWTVGAGAVGRAGNDRLRATVSGGIAWQRVSGAVSSLGFTVFRLGGHSVLFSDEYGVRVAVSPTLIIGGYLAGTFDINVSRSMALTFGTRLLLARETVSAMEVDAVVARNAGVEPPPISRVQAQLAPGPILLAPTRWTVAVGLKALVF